MLVNSKVMFQKAQEGHYAVPSANVLDMESIKNHIGLAERLGLPLIVGVAESHLGDNISLEDAAVVGRKLRDMQESHRPRIHFRHDRRFHEELRRER